jgi:hypothetical protein
LIDWLDYNGYTVVTKATKEFIDASHRLQAPAQGIPKSRNAVAGVLLRRNHRRSGILVDPPTRPSAPRDQRTASTYIFGRFVWPVTVGGVVGLTAAQMSYLPITHNTTPPSDADVP